MSHQPGEQTFRDLHPRQQAHSAEPRHGYADIMNLLAVVLLALAGANEMWLRNGLYTAVWTVIVTIGCAINVRRDSHAWMWLWGIGLFANYARVILFP